MKIAATGIGLAWGLLLWQWAFGTLITDRTKLTLDTTTVEGSHAIARMSTKALREKPWLLEGWVEENGRALPARSPNIRSVTSLGGGRYFVKERNVWLSTRDGTSPADGTREYWLVAGRPVPNICWWLLLAATTALAWPRRQALGSMAWRYVRAEPLIGDSPAQRRNMGLDVMRGVAVLLVFLHHNYVVPGHQQAGIFQSFKDIGMAVGWVGVDLFFVLSGFLIGTLLLKEAQRTGGLHIGRFLLRRMFKIWPSYLAVLLVSLSMVIWAAREGGDPHWWGNGMAAFWHDYWPNLLHCQNYVHTPLLHTWTLAVEEHFYLILPCVVAGCFAFARHRLPIDRRHVPLMIMCVLGLLIGNGLRLTMARPEVDTRLLDLLYRATHFRFDSLLFGCLLAAVAIWHPQTVVKLRRWKWWALAFAIVVSLLPAGTPSGWPDHVQVRQWLYTLLYVAFGGLVLIMNGSGADGRIYRWQGNVIIRAIAHIGTISYTFYLWHYHPLVLDSLARLCGPVGESVNSQAAESLGWLGRTFLYFGLSYAAAWLCTITVEQPFLTLRSRWFPSRSPVAPVAVPSLSPAS